MCKELAILHDEMRVGGRIVEVPMDNCRENARIWQWVACDRDPGRSLAVRIVWREEARETGVCLAPGWLFQIVATTVCVSVWEVWVAHNHLVLLATGHCVSGLAGVQIDAGQQLVGVRTLEGTGRVQLGAGGSLKLLQVGQRLAG